MFKDLEPGQQPDIIETDLTYIILVDRKDCCYTDSLIEFKVIHFKLHNLKFIYFNLSYYIDRMKILQKLKIRILQSWKIPLRESYWCV